MDFTLELVVVPVTDIDRAKAFYSEKVGFNVDVDQSVGDAFRVVQLTPPGSACSISIGKGLSKSEPGSMQGLQMCVTGHHSRPAHRERRLDRRPRWPMELVHVLQRPGRQRLGDPGEAEGRRLTSSRTR